MRMKRILILLALIALTGISCRIPERISPSPEQAMEWEQLSPAFSRKEFSKQLGERSVFFTAYRLKTDLIQAQLFHETEPKHIEEWVLRQPNRSLLFNGGYFDEASQPTGRLIIDGEERGTRSYDENQSGYLLMGNSTASIVSTLPTDLAGLSAIQTFPFLIKNAQPAIREDSGQSARRTIVATGSDKAFYVIIFDRSTVTLYQAANLLLEELPLESALNLDGGSSSALSARFDGFSETHIPLVPLPQIVVLSEKLPDQPHAPQI